jgi:hypothetical protein
MGTVEREPASIQELTTIAKKLGAIDMAIVLSAADELKRHRRHSLTACAHKGSTSAQIGTSSSNT